MTHKFVQANPGMGLSGTAHDYRVSRDFQLLSQSVQGYVSMNNKFPRA